MRQALIETLIEIAKTDSRIMLLTADLGFGVVEKFACSFPDRYLNVGVAEANMVGMATGLASDGFIPFVYSIGTFASLRAYEQIRNGPVFHQLPVRIIGVGGGFSYGCAGFTHYALEDLAIARIQPGLGVIAPADCPQTATAIQATYDLEGPIYYRIDKRDNLEIPELAGDFVLGRVNIVQRGSDVLLLTIGSISVNVISAARILAQEGIEATVAIVSSLRPAPDEDLARLLSRFSLVITVEEHYRDGALGSMVAEAIAERGCDARLMRFAVDTLPDRVCGSESYMRALFCLTGEAIAYRIRKAIE